MKSCWSIFFSLLILAPSTANLLIYFQFKINQEYVAQNLCINRDQPITTCYGSCYLKEKLKQNPVNQEEQPVILTVFEHPVFVQGQLYDLVKPAFFYFDLPAHYLEQLSPSSFIFSIFHPPKA